MAITLTTITDVLAFGLGAISPFNSVRLFCAFTGVCLLFAYLSMILFFAPIMVLDARREEANMSSLTCQVVGLSEPGKSKQSESVPAVANTVNVAGGSKQCNTEPEDVSIAHMRADIAEGNDREKVHERVGASVGGVPGDGEASTQSSAGASAPTAPVKDMTTDSSNYVGASWDIAFAEYLGPVVLSVPGKAVVFALWLGVLGASIYGFTLVEQGLDLQLLAPNGHYFIDA